jgi:hypothetical protein
LYNDSPSESSPTFLTVQIEYGGDEGATVIHAFSDCSLDLPVVSVGYILYRSTNGDEELLETGTRVLNADADDRQIEWSSGRAEYFSAIVAARAALDYTDEPIIFHLDNAGVVKAIKRDTWHHEGYFPHCFRSFAHRFEDWYVRVVHRDQNEKAHRQARVGLRVGREIREGTL